MRFILETLRRCAKHPALCGAVILGLSVEIAYGIAAPFSLQYLVDDAFLPKDADAFALILLLLLAGGALNIAGNVLGDYSIGKLGGLVVLKLRGELFERLQIQSSSFYGRYRVGDLVSRFSSDMTSIERIIRSAIPSFFKETFAVALGLAMLFAIEWKLTLAMLAGSALLIVGPKLLGRSAEAANADYKSAQEQLTHTLDESVKGHKTIRGLHQQSRIGARAREQIQSLYTFGMKLHLTNAMMERIPLTALLVLNGIMIGFGGYLIFHDQMSVGGFLSFFMLFLAVGQSGTNLTYLVPGLIESGVSFRRVSELLEQRPDVPEAAEPAVRPDDFSSLRMDRVTFGYTEAADQLKDVSLDIPGGSYVAFVGASGSGKSTALQLLGRFYDPRDGAVLMNGHDLRAVGEDALRKLATLVGQETFLFNATIRDNLRLDNDALTDADLERAARRAKIHERIAQWPAGYDTPVSLEGGSLSGGERQRLAIARALLRDPKVLLLDEATAALDPGTEADINELMLSIRGGKTVVSVTHRLSSVVAADRIYVFRDGRIEESGTHRELVERRGIYFGLWEKQQGFRLSDDGLHATVDADRLALLPFFAGIERQALEEIATAFAAEPAQAGDTVVREGEEGRKFYIVARGAFEVSKRDARGEDVNVATLRDGDYFGEIALLNDVPRNATVKALGPSLLLTMRREAFARLTASHPALLESLRRTLEERS